MLSLLFVLRYESAAAAEGLSAVSVELNGKHQDFSNSSAVGLKLLKSAAFSFWSLFL